MSALPATHSVDEVAAALGVTRKWLMNAARTNPAMYPSIKVGQHVRFTAAQYEQILTATTRVAGKQPTDSWGRRRRAS